MLKAIDLFAGAGGLSLGFQQTGKFRLVAAAEINRDARATYYNNIAQGRNDFIFIENVIGFDFSRLNKQVGGIDIVIGGPPCQGFSNANRQKNHLISMNNGLIKEFLRAIKEIRPKAFIMENVNMLRSDTHRFYESMIDNQEIDDLAKKGFHLSKRNDSIFLSNKDFEGINLNDLNQIDLEVFRFPSKLMQLISVLYKNLWNQKRLPKYLRNHKAEICLHIDKYYDDHKSDGLYAIDSIIRKLIKIKYALLAENIQDVHVELDYIVSIQKLISSIHEIRQNMLIGEYSITNDGSLVFLVNSYSVIDYVNAILCNEYTQVGNTVNAKWFGVPQDRKRYFVMGIRKDIYCDSDLLLPNEPCNVNVPTVGDAIIDLQSYEVGYNANIAHIEYTDHERLSDYAEEMRKNSISVKNHITTKSTETALERFKVIKQGMNFHSLSSEMKDTYSKPERTQNTIYLRLNLLEPSGTVVNVRKSMWIHPILNRAISVREAARLQSFPDSFEFYGSKDSQYQQVGNAVPPLLAKGIAEHLYKYLK